MSELQDPRTLLVTEVGQMPDGVPLVMAIGLLCECHGLVDCPHAWMFRDDEVLECGLDGFFEPL